MVCSYLLLWYGIIFGMLDWISDIVYYSHIPFHNSSLKAACIVFIILQPIWYIFLYIVYVASHPEIDSHRDRIIKDADRPFVWVVAVHEAIVRDRVIA